MHQLIAAFAIGVSGLQEKSADTVILPPIRTPPPIQTLSGKPVAGILSNPPQVIVSELRDWAAARFGTREPDEIAKALKSAGMISFETISNAERLAELRKSLGAKRVIQPIVIEHGPYFDSHREMLSEAERRRRKKEREKIKPRPVPDPLNDDYKTVSDPGYSTSLQALVVEEGRTYRLKASWLSHAAHTGSEERKHVLRAIEQLFWNLDKK